MKKLLLGSTALAVGGLVAAPAMAADPIKMGVGGYYQFYALAGAIEGTYALNGTSVQYNGIQFIQEGEIHFIGQTKLDNGTSIGLRVELEAWNPAAATTIGGVTNATRQIDEAYLFAFGDWGRVELGGKDDAPYIMYYGTPSALLGFGFVQHNTSFSWTNPTANANNAAAFHISAMTLDAQYQDVNRINYYTPRFAGLQVGISYTPKMNIGTGSMWGLQPGPGANTAGVCGFNDATTANGCPTNDNSWFNAVAIGANYLNKFGVVSVAAYVGYSYAGFTPSNNYTPQTSGLITGANLINGANLTNWKQFAAGLQFSAYGFTVGGSYIWDNNGLGANYYTGQNNDTNAFSAGMMYETGPWQFSVGGTISTNNNGNGIGSVVNCAQGTTSSCSIQQAASSSVYFGNNTAAGAARFGTVTASKIEVGANYALGPGIKMMGGAIFNTLSGPSNAVAGQSWAALLGMDFRF
ncbi:porin [Enhydrobacter aerosaccus]|uniref:Porin n=2 Tax=Enhydrobacter aerosaccus TaxID=225324 RepID=A0A1T4QQJ7_9HYPH|nr:porin [Enhydrobacter aerosaccus]